MIESLRSVVLQIPFCVEAHGSQNSRKRETFYTQHLQAQITPRPYPTPHSLAGISSVPPVTERQIDQFGPSCIRVIYRLLLHPNML
jgi:hypothetical protein